MHKEGLIMKYLSSNISKKLYDNGFIQKNDIEICRYGIEIFISTVLEISSILLISIFAKNFFETIMYFAAFIPLRLYAGGYHADTRLRCYLISLGVYFLFSFVIDIIPRQAYLTTNLLCTTISFITVITFAPIIHCNKKTALPERKYYRKVSIGICSIETVLLLLISVLFPSNILTTSFALGEISVSLSMLAAILKNNFKNKVN